MWCSDITYIPMQYGFMYLVAVMDWWSRYVLAWALSNTMEAEFCIRAWEAALAHAAALSVGPFEALLEEVAARPRVAHAAAAAASAESADSGAFALVGGQQEEIRVAVDPAKLAGYGLSLQQLQNALAAANAYFAAADYFRADALYTDLRKAFPSSEHQFIAHFLGLKTKLLCKCLSLCRREIC